MPQHQADAPLGEENSMHLRRRTEGMFPVYLRDVCEIQWNVLQASGILTEAGLNAGTGGFDRSVNILSAWLWSLVFSEAFSLRGSLLIAADTTELLRDSTA